MWQFPCFWWPWQFWIVELRYYREWPSTWICPKFFSWLDRGFGFRGGRRWAIAPHPMKCACYQQSYHSCYDLDRLVQVVFVIFLHWKVLLLLSYTVLFKEVIMHKRYLRSWDRPPGETVWLNRVTRTVKDTPRPISNGFTAYNWQKTNSSSIQRGS